MQGNVKMKILNLYSGIGGNRKLWGDEHQITAVEYRQDIADVYHHFFPNDKIVVADAHQYLLDHYKEFDFIWASPPCQTHSRAKLWGHKNSEKVKPEYPDMKLYQEILFLQHFYKGLWIIENVDPFYNPLIPASIKLGRHLFWSNFKITYFKVKEADINKGTQKHWRELHGFDLSNFKFKSRKDQIYRNCVHPETGLHILNCAIGRYENEKIKPLTLF